MEAKALIATTESDASLRLKELEKGSQARNEGLLRTACPWSGGMCKTWWLKGYDTPHHPINPIIASTYR